MSLARLLGTVGVLPNNSDGLLDYALATYAVPRTQRSAEIRRPLKDANILERKMMDILQIRWQP